MRNIIRFHVSRDDSHYVASGADLPVVTQGKTLDELAENIKEAVSLHLEGEDLAGLELSQTPSVLVDFEMPVNHYA